jgi:hypothetical protein
MWVLLSLAANQRWRRKRNGLKKKSDDRVDTVYWKNESKEHKEK